MKHILNLFTVGLVTIFLSGCATIVGEKTQLVAVNSSPSDAVVKIKDEKGVEVFKGKTPTTVTLHKSDGSYWGGKEYIVTISKDGFESQIIPIVSSPNGWYIAGNIAFGGLIGWFVVDPLSGAMYNLSPEQVNTSLSTTISHNQTLDDGNISIVLLEDVPNDLRKKMTRIN